MAQMPAITLRQLEIFAQAVEHGSFRRCAEHIGISQVAVSDHVRALEAGLGHALFKREAGGPARLTAEGERAYRRVVDILSDVNDLVWDLSADRSRRTLVVAAAPFLMDHLQDSLEAFGRLHPGVEVRVEPETAETAVLQERVRERILALWRSCATVITICSWMWLMISSFSRPQRPWPSTSSRKRWMRALPR